MGTRRFIRNEAKVRPQTGRRLQVAVAEVVEGGAQGHEEINGGVENHDSAG